MCGITYDGLLKIISWFPYGHLVIKYFIKVIDIEDEERTSNKSRIGQPSLNQIRITKKDKVGSKLYKNDTNHPPTHQEQCETRQTLDLHRTHSFHALLHPILAGKREKNRMLHHQASNNPN